MRSNTWSRYIKYFFKPQKVIHFFINKVKLLIRYYYVIYATKFNKIKCQFGNNIKFNQSTLITGKGSIIIGEQTSFGYEMGGYFYKGVCELQSRYDNSKIIIGSNVLTNNNLFICCANEVIIGDNTLIGEGVIMTDHDAHGIYPDERRTSIGKVEPIHIGENVWIGSRVIVLPGTKIGKNSIIGAGSLIKGEFPANVIIAGNPGKVIKTIENI